jgi:hypothetical protein
MFAQERQGISDEEIAKLASRAMKQFDVPALGATDSEKTILKFSTFQVLIIMKTVSILRYLP